MYCQNGNIKFIFLFWLSGVAFSHREVRPSRTVGQGRDMPQPALLEVAGPVPRQCSHTLQSHRNKSVDR